MDSDVCSSKSLINTRNSLSTGFMMMNRINKEFPLYTMIGTYDHSLTRNDTFAFTR